MGVEPLSAQRGLLQHLRDAVRRDQAGLERPPLPRLGRFCGFAWFGLVVHQFLCDVYFIMAGEQMNPGVLIVSYFELIFRVFLKAKILEILRIFFLVLSDFFIGEECAGGLI